MNPEWSEVFVTEARNVQFCHECGSLLNIPSTSNVLVCNICGASAEIDGKNHIKTLTKNTHYSNFLKKIPTQGLLL